MAKIREKRKPKTANVFCKAKRSWEDSEGNQYINLVGSVVDSRGQSFSIQIPVHESGEVRMSENRYGDSGIWVEVAEWGRSTKR